MGTIYRQLVLMVFLVFYGLISVPGLFRLPASGWFAESGVLKQSLVVNIDFSKNDVARRVRFTNSELTSNAGLIESKLEFCSFQVLTFHCDKYLSHPISFFGKHRLHNGLLAPMRI